MNEEVSEPSENVIHLHGQLLEKVSDRLGRLAFSRPAVFCRTMARWYLDRKVPEDALFRTWAALTRESPALPSGGHRSKFAAELLLEAAEDTPATRCEDHVSLHDLVREKALEEMWVKVHAFCSESSSGVQIPDDPSSRILTPLTEMALLLNIASDSLARAVNDPAAWVRNGLPLYRAKPEGTYNLVDEADPVVQFLLLSHQIGAKLPSEPLPEWMTEVFVRTRDKQVHDWMFNGHDCYALTGDAHAERQRALRRHLELPDATSTGPVPLNDAGVADYLRPDHPRYASKLAAAVRAWEAVTEPLPGTTVKQSLDKWLTENAGQFRLSGKAIEDCSAISNWMTKGGAPKTPA